MPFPAVTDIVNDCYVSLSLSTLRQRAPQQHDHQALRDIFPIITAVARWPLTIP